MNTPSYIGSADAMAPAPKSGLLSSVGLSLPGITPPVYVGDSGGAAAGGGAATGTPGLLKRLTFTILSPQLAKANPVDKSQPVVVAVPDGATSYEIVSGLLGVPANPTPGTVPATPNAFPVGIDEQPKAALTDTDSQVQITVSWGLCPGSTAAGAGERKALVTIEFYGA